MKIKQLFTDATKTVAKHSPLILTGLGIVGLGATAYLAVKASKKLDIVMSEYEEAEEEGAEISKVEIARDVIAIYALPVAVGVASITCMTFSYRILNNRIHGLSAALSAVTTEYAVYRKRVKNEYGEEKDIEFSGPAMKRAKVKGKGGKEEEVNVGKDEAFKNNNFTSHWFNDSSECMKDDQDYNLSFIRSIETKAQDILFQRGTLTLNELLDMLGFCRTRGGAVVGWTSGDFFFIDARIIPWTNQMTGDFDEEVYVNWAPPKDVYNELDFNGGRYSSFN